MPGASGGKTLMPCEVPAGDDLMKREFVSWIAGWLVGCWCVEMQIPRLAALARDDRGSHPERSAQRGVEGSALRRFVAGAVNSLENRPTSPRSNQLTRAAPPRLSFATERAPRAA